MSWYVQQQDSLTLKVWIQPGAKKTVIVGAQGDFLKIKLRALPIEGKANIALIKWLSKLLNVPQKNIVITHGLQSRQKTIVIKNYYLNQGTIEALGDFL